MTSQPIDDTLSLHRGRSSSLAVVDIDGEQATRDPAPTAVTPNDGTNSKHNAHQKPAEADDAGNPPPSETQKERNLPDSTKNDKLDKLHVNMKELVDVDEVVQEYLVQLRSVELCEGWILSPRAIFGITLFLFFLPSLWSMCEVLIKHQLPEYVFYDRCRNGTGDAAASILQGKNSVEFPYDVCVRCAGNTPHVYTNSSTVTFESQAGFAAIVVAFNVVLTFIATIFFVRLSIKEFTCIHFLGYDVLVQSRFDFRAVCILVTTTIMCVVAAAISVAYEYFVRLKLDNIPLGYKLRQNDTDYQCYSGNISSGLYAVFDTDNPSVAASFSPHEPLTVVAAVLAAFLLYVPIVVRLLGLVTSSFNSFKVKDLMSNSRITAKIFADLAYTVDYDDLMKCIQDYAETQDAEECSCSSVITRIFSFHCNCADPPADFFGFTWGFTESDMNVVMSLLLERGQLKKFASDESATELTNAKERKLSHHGKLKGAVEIHDHDDDEGKENHLDQGNETETNPLAKQQK